MIDAKRQKVEESYTAKHAEAIELLGSLQRIVEDMPSPGGESRINWGDVGSIGYLCKELKCLKILFGECLYPDGRSQYFDN